VVSSGQKHDAGAGYGLAGVKSGLASGKWRAL
jgi:hypothetical protein